MPRQFTVRTGATVQDLIHFNSWPEMQAYLIRAQADAAANMHPAQAAISWGDHWVRFIDISNRVVEFGRVFTRDEVRESEIEAGATSIEARRAVQECAIGMEKGYLYGHAASFLYPSGEVGYSHKSVVWPIEEATYNAAAEVNWQIDRMPVSQKINLQIAFIAWKGRDL
jgi:hypothetical protein